MQGRWLSRVLALPLALFVSTIAASAASAQAVVFTGRVTAQGGQPLAGASVAIPEIGVGAVATAEGRYSFTVADSRLRGRTVNVIARYLGYKPKRLPVTNPSG